MKELSRGSRVTAGLRRKATLSGTASIIALLIGLLVAGTTSADNAQSTGNAALLSLSAVNVTASRIAIPGFSAPTPTIVLTARALQTAAEPNLFNAVAQLPSLATSWGSQSGPSSLSAGTGGINAFNIHALGLDETLTLLDGERVVSPLLNDEVDNNVMPQGLIKNVQVVTGGASASWGSDAVAGVVNYVVDHNFNGFQANIEGSSTAYDDDNTGLAEITAGTGFDDGRGHIEADVEAYHDAGVPDGIDGRDWYHATEIVGNSIAGTPPGSPQYYVMNDAAANTATAGGIITAGPLKGTAFGAGGEPYEYNYGQTYGSYTVGGSYLDSEVSENHGGLDQAVSRGNVYVRASFDLTPSTNLYATFLYAQARTENIGEYEQYENANLTIQCDNPYVPGSVQAACAKDGITSFQYGTNNLDLGTATGGLQLLTRTLLDRWTVGADGAFHAVGSDWTWQVNEDYGVSSRNDSDPESIITPYYLAAINAVTGPNGTIECASATARALGCQPLDILGTGVASKNAIDWVLGDPSQTTEEREEVFSASINGTPLSTWAGPLSVAAGYDFRYESFTAVATCATYGNCPTAGDPAGNPLLSVNGANYFAGNLYPSQGAYHISEVFFETDFPFLKGKPWGDADLDLGGRESDYNTAAGLNATWKAGLNYSPGNVGVRFRIVQSHDVHAPNLSQLYTPIEVGVGTVVDDFPPYAGQTEKTTGETIPNDHLEPEEAANTEAGIVLQPHWLPSFSASVDYYRITLTHQIGSFGGQDAVNLCFEGNGGFCSLITRNSAGVITSVDTIEYNLASTFTDGLDIEAAYQVNLPDVGGTFVVSYDANHIMSYIETPGLPGTIPLQMAGVNSGLEYAYPSWIMHAVETFTRGKYSLSLTEHYVSAGVISDQYIQCTSNCPVSTINYPTINNNHIAGALYWGIGGSYDVTKHSQVYFKIDNLANTAPAVAPYDAQYSIPINPSIYDVLGRTYRIGFRLNL